MCLQADFSPRGAALGTPMRPSLQNTNLLLEAEPVTTVTGVLSGCNVPAGAFQPERGSPWRASAELAAERRPAHGSCRSSSRSALQPPDAPQPGGHSLPGLFRRVIGTQSLLYSAPILCLMFKGPFAAVTRNMLCASCLSRPLRKPSAGQVPQERTLYGDVSRTSLNPCISAEWSAASAGHAAPAAEQQ